MVRGRPSSYGWTREVARHDRSVRVAGGDSRASGWKFPTGRHVTWTRKTTRISQRYLSLSNRLFQKKKKNRILTQTYHTTNNFSNNFATCTHQTTGTVLLPPNLCSFHSCFRILLEEFEWESYVLNAKQVAENWSIPVYRMQGLLRL